MIRSIRATGETTWEQAHPIHVTNGVIGGVDVRTLPWGLLAEWIHGRETHDGGVIASGFVFIDVESVHLLVRFAVVFIRLDGLVGADTHGYTGRVIEGFLYK